MKKLIYILILVGCSNKKLDHGIITGLYFSPAHSYIMTTYMMVGHMMMPITTTNYAPDEWTAEFTGNYNGKKIINEIEITQQEYNSYQTGDTIKLTK